MEDEKKLVSVGGEDVESVLEIELNDNSRTIDNKVKHVATKNCGAIKKRCYQIRIVRCRIYFKIMKSNKLNSHMKQHGDVSLHELVKNKVPKQEWKCTICLYRFTFEHLLNQHRASKHSVI